MREWLEKAVGSFGFSALCFLVWGGLTVPMTRGLVQSFSLMELVWLLYNATIAVLFLVRSTPKAVSLNPMHWLVALLASFSGFFFETVSPGIRSAGFVGDSLVLLGIVGSGSAAIALRRSYDFVPALRGVTTDWLYRYMRHPMYLSSIIIRLGYLIRHASTYNSIVFAIMILLYLKRMDYEERIMGQHELYVEYARRVRYRLLPGLY